MRELLGKTESKIVSTLSPIEFVAMNPQGTSKVHSHITIELAERDGLPNIAGENLSEDRAWGPGNEKMRQDMQSGKQYNHELEFPAIGRQL